MRSPSRWFLVPSASVLLVSCVTSFFPRQDALVWKPLPTNAVFVLDEPEVSTKPTTGDLKHTAFDLAQLEARKAGISLEPGEGSVFDLKLTLEEREFGVDIDTYNSVSAVMKIWSREEEPVQVGQIVYAEDTKLTLRSANYLDHVLESLFQQLSQKLKEKK